MSWKFIKIASIGLCLAATAAQAAPFDPIVELFRLGAGDRLRIDRGGPVDLAGDVNGDGLDDLMIGSGIGGIRVVFGPTRGNDGVLNGQQLDGVSGFTILHDEINISHLSGAGDINNDGLGDMIVGSKGGAHVYLGSREPFPRLFDASDLNGRNGFSIDTAATNVSDVGDINNDGFDDLIIGNGDATINDLPGVGIAYVIFGKASGFDANLAKEDIRGDVGFAIIGAQQQDRIGYSVGRAGDFNHDGIDDIMIGAPNKTQGDRAEAGEAYILYGRAEGFPDTVSVSDLSADTGLVFRGVDRQNATGASVSGIGDLNHDGVDDVAIGSPGKGPFGSPTDFPGDVYILFGGKFTGVSQIDRTALNGSNGMRVRGIRGGVVPIQEGEAIWGDLAGTSLDGIGDFNGDGMDDLLIGASHTIINPSRKGVGQTYVIYGSQSAFPDRLSLRDLDGANGFRINGIGTVDYYGVYTRSAGDFNDDGVNDFVAGASGEGASFVIYGRDFGFGVIPAPSTPSFNATPPQMLAAARIYGVDVPSLSFNELPDPTGPTPLPGGTPTDLTNPETPGYIAANVFEPVPVLRPEEVPTSVVVPPVVNPTTPPIAAPPVTEPESPVAPPEATPGPGESPVLVVDPIDDNNVSSAIKVGAASILDAVVLLLILMLYGCTYGQLKRDQK